MKFKRVVVLSDTHCGSKVGLTPPDHQFKITNNHKRNKYSRLQSECWDWFSNAILKINDDQRIQLLVCNGDLIDGDGWRDGGTEQLTTDRQEQAEIAIDVLKYINAKNVSIVEGTQYHTGTAEDFERDIAKYFAAKIGAHDWFDVNGTVFDCKHHVGRSSIPHGKYTPIARDHLWAVLWKERGLIPNIDVLVRSHVHYFSYCGGPEWLALTTPCLKAMGDRYGARRCSDIIDYGFVVFDCYENGSYDWRVVLADLQQQKTKVIKY